MNEFFLIFVFFAAVKIKMEKRQTGVAQLILRRL
jgi:hypothetical protein